MRDGSVLRRDRVSGQLGVILHGGEDVGRCGAPDSISRGHDMLQCIRDRAQAEGLTGDETVQHHAHHQRLIAAGSGEFLELVDDHPGKVPGSNPATDHRRAVVQFRGVGNRQDRSVSGGEPDRLIVEPEVENIVEARAS